LKVAKNTNNLQNKEQPTMMGSFTERGQY